MRSHLQQVTYGGILWRSQSVWGSCVGLQACGRERCLIWLPCLPLEYEATSCQAHSSHRFPLPSHHLPSLRSSPWVPANFYIYLATGAGNILRFFYAWRTFSTSFWIFWVWLVTVSSDQLQAPSGMSHEIQIVKLQWFCLGVKCSDICVYNWYYTI